MKDEMKKTILLLGPAVLILGVWWYGSGMRSRSVTSGNIITVVSGLWKSEAGVRKNVDSKAGEIGAGASVQGALSVDEKFLSESRNEVWAKAAETNIKDSLSRVEGVQEVMVECHTSVCRVMGKASLAESSDVESLVSGIRRASKFRDGDYGIGLDRDNTKYTVDSVKPFRIKFVNYTAP